MKDNLKRLVAELITPTEAGKKALEVLGIKIKNDCDMKENDVVSPCLLNFLKELEVAGCPEVEFILYPDGSGKIRTFATITGFSDLEDLSRILSLNERSNE